MNLIIFFCNTEGRIHVYKYDKDLVDEPKRTSDSYVIDLSTAISTNKPYRGIKGKSALSSLSDFENPLGSTNIDYMHSLLYGVVGKLFDLWFSPEFSKEEFSLYHHIGEIDKKLVGIKPNKSIPYAPRSISQYKLWRAHEYLSFILYYSLYVFYGIMKVDYYENFMILAISTEILLSKRIQKDSLLRVKGHLIRFVSQLEDLYSTQVMVSGVHELLHLVECTLDFGPLNCLSCFQFEELNRLMKNMIKGKYRIGEEFIKLFTLLQSLDTYIKTHEFKNGPLKDFISKYSYIRSSNKKRLYNKPTIKLGRIANLKSFFFSF